MMTLSAAFLSHLPVRLSHSSSSSSSLSTQTTTQNSRCPAIRPRCCTDYEREELIQRSGDNMTVWNEVIHASLKRKLHTIISEENPVTSSGVSSLLTNTYSSSSSSPASNTSTLMSPAYQQQPSSSSVPEPTPDEVVNGLLAMFKKDALLGATKFVSIASNTCHVKHTNPQTLLLFIGDNQSYRPLLRVNSFKVHSPRYESCSNQKCVVTVDVHLPDVGKDECATFDFQLSLDVSGHWLIDEVFRL